MPLGTNGSACAEIVAVPAPEPEVVLDAVPAPVDEAPEVVEPVAVVEAPIAEAPVIVAVDETLPLL